MQAIIHKVIGISCFCFDFCFLVSSFLLAVWFEGRMGVVVVVKGGSLDFVSVIITIPRSTIIVTITITITIEFSFIF